MKSSSHTPTVDWPFATFWLLYLSSIFTFGYIIILSAPDLPAGRRNLCYLINLNAPYMPG